MLIKELNVVYIKYFIKERFAYYIFGNIIFYVIINRNLGMDSEKAIYVFALLSILALANMITLDCLELREKLKLSKILSKASQDHVFNSSLFVIPCIYLVAVIVIANLYLVTIGSLLSITHLLTLIVDTAITVEIIILTERLGQTDSYIKLIVRTVLLLIVVLASLALV